MSGASGILRFSTHSHSLDWMQTKEEIPSEEVAPSDEVAPSEEAVPSDEVASSEEVAPSDLHRDISGGLLQRNEAIVIIKLPAKR